MNKHDPGGAKAPTYVEVNPNVADETPEEKRIWAKVSRRVMPLAILGLFIAYVDRVNIAVVGSSMRESLSLSPSVFGLAAGLFSIGYILFEIPSNLAMDKFGAKIWIARIMVTWGLITVATTFVVGANSLYVARLLLGIAEAGFYPGLLFYFGLWFPAKRLARAYSLFQLGIPISLALGSVLTAQLLRLDGVWGVHGWQWVFIIEGAAAVILGIITLFYMANGPKDAKWLTESERTVVQSALKAESAGAHAGGSHSGSALMSVVKSKAAWYYTVTFFFILVGFYAVTYWLPQIIQERFTVGPVQAGFISALPWCLSAISLLLVSKRVQRTGNRGPTLAVVLIVCAAGLAVSALTGSAVVALIGLCVAACVQAGVPLLMSFPSQHFPGAQAAVALALVNSVANLGGFVGPWLLGVLRESTGDNQAGLLMLSGSFIIAAVLALGLARQLRTATSVVSTNTRATSTD
ncbi:MFS transporter [Rhodococcus sp. B10]|uniref:MFS transporter n=1 Tax=Rhodococcus sp. B10 TaxID=2695876 RepID=UPI001430B952|nr:MFS transporter [Rhodococcus sp. B10]NIL77280.1 putative tartrate transporter [Rhodococcus sp. B10]